MSIKDPFNSPMPLKIKYEYKTAKDCPTVYSHGVWGGINQYGEIEMNVYAESDKLPEFSECALNPDGTPGPEISSQDEHTKEVTRTIHAKVLLNYHTARAVIEWLEEKIQTLELEAPEGLFPMDDNNGLSQ